MKLGAAILDWAGTTVDFGSVAPVRVLEKLFRDRGVAISEPEARRDMGLLKKDHIRRILSIPRVRQAWTEAHGAPAAETDVEGLFADFIPLQLDCLAEYSSLISGVADAVARMRQRGMRIGTTTGYTRPMLELLLKEAAAQGYIPDCSVCPDDVGAGRPFPWMCYQNAVQLKVPLEATVKIGDTVSDVEEGRNARMWTIGIMRTGNLRNDPDQGRAKLLAAGAHYVAGSVAECDEILDAIEERLRRGERP